MKKFIKWFAAFAAIMTVFSFAGCKNDENNTEAELLPVESVDDDPKVANVSGTYDFTSTTATNYTYADDANYNSSMQMVFKGILEVKGTSDDSDVKMTMTEYSMEAKFADATVYEGAKKSAEENDNPFEFGYPATFDFDDANLTMKVSGKINPTFEGAVQTMKYPEFKKELLDFPEDKVDGNYSYKYSDKSIKMTADGSRIEQSYKEIETYTYTDTGKTDTTTNVFKTVLVCR